MEPEFKRENWTAARLQTVTQTYHSLEPKTRIRILLSFLHLPLRTLTELQTELVEFVRLGCADSDPWIRAISSIVSSLPERGCLNEASILDASNTAAYRNLLALVNSKQLAPLNIPPVDTMYLTRPTATTLFSSVASTAARLMSPPTAGGPSANVPSLLPHHQLVKHFALRRKPKSAELRAQLVQRSADLSAAGSLRGGSGTSNPTSASSNMSTVPIKMRSFAKKMNMDSTETGKGFDGFLPSSRLSSSTYAMAGNRQHSATVPAGGVKIVELSELPTGFDPRKRHRASVTVSSEPVTAKQKPPVGNNAHGVNNAIEETPKPEQKEESITTPGDAVPPETQTVPASNTTPVNDKAPTARKRRGKSASGDGMSSAEKKEKKEVTEKKKEPKEPKEKKTSKEKEKKDTKGKTEPPPNDVTNTTATAAEPVISTSQEDADKEAKEASESITNALNNTSSYSTNSDLQVNSVMRTTDPATAVPDFDDVPKLVSCLTDASSSTYRLTVGAGAVSAMNYNSTLANPTLAPANPQIAQQAPAGSLFSLFQQPVKSVPVRVVPASNQHSAFPATVSLDLSDVGSGNIPQFKLIRLHDTGVLSGATNLQQIQLQQVASQQQQQQEQQQQEQQSNVVFTAQGPVIIPSSR